MRILPKEEKGSREPVLGVEEGGLESAEALLLARYFMFSQVYYHPVRLMYDRHLYDFLTSWLKKERKEEVFPTTYEGHLKYTDNEVMSSILSVAKDESHPAHAHAARIVHRRHFKNIYRPTAGDKKLSLESGKSLKPGKKMYEAASKEFGKEKVKHVQIPQKRGKNNFPVLVQGNFPVLIQGKRIAQAVNEKETFSNIPSASCDHVFAAPEIRDKAGDWLEANRERILSSAGEN